MSVLAAFYTVAGVCGFSLIGGFFYWKFRYVIQSGWFRAEIICEDGDIKVFTMRLKASDEAFTRTVKGKLDRYDILPERVYRLGRVRLPKSFYNSHCAEPIDMRNLRMESKVSATRAAAIAKNTVTSQLLNAFNENPLVETMMFILGIGIILVGILILGYFLNSKLTTLQETVTGVPAGWLHLQAAANLLHLPK